MRKISARGFLTLFQFTRSSRSATRLDRSLTALRIWFQFTRSSRSATASPRTGRRFRPRFNSRAPRGARREKNFRPWIPDFVSIHALLAERDHVRAAVADERHCFNSRAPRGARHRVPSAPPRDDRGFNSRAPRGARLEHAGDVRADGECFNSRAPRGARHAGPPPRGRDTGVSIHALLAERDLCRSARPGSAFQVSIHALLAERDSPLRRLPDTNEVSIHALLAERD